MQYKIQTLGVNGWADLRRTEDGSVNYKDYFFNTRKEAEAECVDLNKYLGGGFRVVKSTTEAVDDIY
jgi:hypothetical protein